LAVAADVIVQDALERKLYVIRKRSSSAIQQLNLTHSKEYYVPSMSAAPLFTRACCWPIKWARTTSI
jgi:glutamate synthase domain-containing protein 1